MPLLVVTKTYQDTQILTEADLDGIKDSLEVFFNVTKIDAANIQDLAITTIKIANDAVDKDKIAADVAGVNLAQNVDGSLELAENIDIAGTLDVTGDTILDSTLQIGGGSGPVLSDSSGNLLLDNGLRMGDTVLSEESSGRLLVANEIRINDNTGPLLIKEGTSFRLQLQNELRFADSDGPILRRGPGPDPTLTLQVADHIQLGLSTTNGLLSTAGTSNRIFLKDSGTGTDAPLIVGPQNGSALVIQSGSNAIANSPTGTPIVFAQAFSSPPVVVAVANASDGRFAVVNSITTSQFNAEIISHAGAQNAGTADWIAIGIRAF